MVVEVVYEDDAFTDAPPGDVDPVEDPVGTDGAPGDPVVEEDVEINDPSTGKKKKEALEEGKDEGGKEEEGRQGEDAPQKTVGASGRKDPISRIDES
ncbi:hypothetical protein MHU86_16495 [Fragilaria crotonensis]|nr:hypothetical protein MHU86_16495 [Fragilaria crotonensis]